MCSDHPVVSSPHRSLGASSGAVPTDVLERYLHALLSGDRASSEAIVDELLVARVTVPQLYEELMKPALYRVGDLWARNRISVATEQLATVLTEGLLDRVYPAVFNPHRCGRRVALATVEGEPHQVGLRMVADLFEMHGWETRLIPAGVPLVALLESIEQDQPDLIGLSVSVSFHLDRLEQTLQGLRAVHPTLPILVGGQGVVDCVRARIEGVPGVKTLRSLADLHLLLMAGPDSAGLRSEHIG
jgi:methanogenic corrinoid protein MtbC1